jgi:hypothetical protein
MLKYYKMKVFYCAVIFMNGYVFNANYPYLTVEW